VFAYNNIEHFQITSAEGGVKVTGGQNMVWQNNISESNYGRGLWCDLSCYNVNIVRNVVRNNLDRGIQYEVSSNAIIAGNTVYNNSIDGIAILESWNLSIYNNTLVRNKQNIRILEGSRSSNVSNVAVRNNIFWEGNSTSVSLFGVDDVTHQKTAEQMGVSANYNGYYRPSTSSPSTLVQWSRWPTSILMLKSFSSFQSNGQEKNGIGIDASTDPLFVNGAGNDFHLQSTSPAKGRGVPLPSAVGSALGVVSGVIVDLGAYI